MYLNVFTKIIIPFYICILYMFLYNTFSKPVKRTIKSEEILYFCNIFLMKYNQYIFTYYKIYNIY